MYKLMLSMGLASAVLAGSGGAARAQLPPEPIGPVRTAPRNDKLKSFFCRSQAEVGRAVSWLLAKGYPDIMIEEVDDKVWLVSGK
jgi:hypothetical protein